MARLLQGSWFVVVEMSQAVLEHMETPSTAQTTAGDSAHDAHSHPMPVPNGGDKDERGEAAAGNDDSTKPKQGKRAKTMAGQPLQHTMLAFCADEIQRDTALGRTPKNRGYCPDKGNFPDMVINAWLHDNRQPAIRLKCINDSIPRNSSQVNFLDGLPDRIHALVVR